MDVWMDVWMDGPLVSGYSTGNKSCPSIIAEGRAAKLKDQSTGQIKMSPNLVSVTFGSSYHTAVVISLHMTL